MKLKVINLECTLFFYCRCEGFFKSRFPHCRFCGKIIIKKSRQLEWKKLKSRIEILIDRNVKGIK